MVPVGDGLGRPVILLVMSKTKPDPSDSQENDQL